MATLSDDELARLKHELGQHLLAIGAEPYWDHAYVFTRLQANLTSSSTAATYSSTTVSAAGPTTLTLGSASGISVGTRLVVDVDASREVVTVRNVSGATVSVICTKTHSGTYPVEIESPLTIVRGILADLAAFDDKLMAAADTGGLKAVDEVQWFGGGADGQTRHQAITAARAARRADLAMACGLTDLLQTNTGGGRSLVPY